MQLLVGKNTVIWQLILWKIYGSTELNIYGIYDENDMLKLHGEIQSAHFGLSIQHYKIQTFWINALKLVIYILTNIQHVTISTWWNYTLDWLNYTLTLSTGYKLKHCGITSWYYKLHGEKMLSCNKLNMMILHTGLFKLQADII